MKKVCLFFILGMFSIVMMIGCQKATPETQIPDPNTNVETPQKDKEIEDNQGITENKVAFETIELEEVDQDIRQSAERLMDQRGYKVWTQGDGGYIVWIGAGEKPTGGYSIAAVSIEDQEGKTVVTVEETTPGSNDVVIMALTYPYTLIKLGPASDLFEVVTVEGEVLQGLQESQAEETEEPLEVAVGRYVGAIDNNSIEIEVDGVPTAFRTELIRDQIPVLTENAQVKVQYYQNEYGQLMVKAIEKIQ